jgi:hypothetical protein
VVATPGALALMVTAGIDPTELLQRHQAGDWGDLDLEAEAACDAEDQRENDYYAVSRQLRILSAYGRPPSRLSVITEADRSLTTILRPDE